MRNPLPNYWGCCCWYTDLLLILLPLPTYLSPSRRNDVEGCVVLFTFHQQQQQQQLASYDFDARVQCSCPWTLRRLEATPSLLTRTTTEMQIIIYPITTAPPSFYFSFCNLNTNIITSLTKEKRPSFYTLSSPLWLPLRVVAVVFVLLQ